MKTEEVSQCKYHTTRKESKSGRLKRECVDGIEEDKMVIYSIKKDSSTGKKGES